MEEKCDTALKKKLCYKENIVSDVEVIMYSIDRKVAYLKRKEEVPYIYIYIYVQNIIKLQNKTKQLQNSRTAVI